MAGPCWPVNGYPGLIGLVGMVGMVGLVCPVGLGHRSVAASPCIDGIIARISRISHAGPVPCSADRGAVIPVCVVREGLGRLGQARGRRVNGREMHHARMLPSTPMARPEQAVHAD